MMESGVSAAQEVAGQKRQRLEIPSVTPLERRLQLGNCAPASKPQIGPVQPSSVLDRVKGFLPAMERANAELARVAAERPPQELDIEHVPEGAPHVEMDLSCGILDLKDPAAVARAEAAMRAGPMHAAAPDAACSSSDEDKSDDKVEDEETGEGGQGGVEGEAHAQTGTDRLAPGSNSEARPPGAGRRAKKAAGIVELNP